MARDLHARPTLVAIHDTSTAWLGLGSSLATLKQQIRARSDIWKITLITIYLAGIFALHITAPNLFNMISIPAFDPSAPPTISSAGRPSFSKVQSNSYGQLPYFQPGYYVDGFSVTEHFPHSRMPF